MALYNKTFLIASRLQGLIDIYHFNPDQENSQENGSLLHSYKLPVEKDDDPVSLLTFLHLGFFIVAYSKSASIFVIHFDKDSFDTAPLRVSLPSRLKAKSTSISAFTANPHSPGIFAYGGKDNDLQIIRLFDSNKLSANDFDFANADSWKPKVLFKARNVEPDHLGLDVPVWVSGILFHTPESLEEGSDDNGFRLVVSSRHGHIRVYDTNRSKRPVSAYKVCEKPIITLNFANNTEESIIITDTHTFSAHLSLVKVDPKAQKIVSASAGTFYRPSLKVLGKYSAGGNTGALAAISVSFATDTVVTGGLDRYVRVFNVSDRLLLTKVYLGTQISSIIYLDDDSEMLKKQKEEEEKDDAEDLWQQLEENHSESDSDEDEMYSRKQEEEEPKLIRKKRRI